MSSSLLTTRLLTTRLSFCISKNFGVPKRWTSSQKNNITSWMNLGYESPEKDRLAIVDDDKEMRYGDLADVVGRKAAFLRKHLHLKPGDRLLARVDKSVDSLSLYLATLRLGGIYVPVNPSYTQREMQHFVKDCAPKVLVTSIYESDSIFNDGIVYVLEASKIYTEAKKEQPIYHVESLEKDDIACICYTSGTTGLPKGAMLSHASLIWNAKALIELWRFTKDDVLLHCLPFYHVHGMFISLNCSFLSASSIIFRPKFDADDVIKYLPKSTVMMGVPTYYSRLLEKKAFSAELTRNIRLFVSGSAPMTNQLWEAFRRHTGHKILERYGMTEAAVITSNPYENDGRFPGTVGKILSGGQMRISPENIVEIRLPSIFKGYWRNPEKTKSEFTSDGFFITGDLGRIDSLGYLHILGRGKDLIITGGLNVYPKEVEDVLNADELIKESAVIGVQHPEFGEAVVAVCVPKFVSVAEAYSNSPKLLARLREKLANYKLPKRFVFLENLPRNSMGKVQKDLLRNQYSDN